MSFNDYFPDLRIDILKVYAKSWAQRYSLIDTIWIYRIINPSILQNNQFKYTLVFVLRPILRWTKKKIVLRNEINEDYAFGKFMDRGFIDVYRSEPSWQFRDEWWMVTIEANEKIPEYFSHDTGWQLYPNAQHLSPESDHTQDDNLECIPSQIHGHKADIKYAFIRNGEYWEVTYENEQSLIKDRKRLHYLIYLLASPGTKISNDALVRAVNKTVCGMTCAEVEAQKEDGLDREMNISTRYEHEEWVSQVEGKKEYNELCRALEEAKRQGNQTEIIIAEEELDQFVERTKPLRQKVSSVISKSRKNVDENIRNVKKDILKSHPNLIEFIEHINTYVRISTSSSEYLLENSKNWLIKW